MLYKGVELYNVRELLPLEGPTRFGMSRVANHIRLQLSEFGQRMALNGSGSEIRFNLEGSEARITLLRDPDYPVKYGIVQRYNGNFQGHQTIGPLFVGQNEPGELVIPRLPDDAMQHLTHMSKEQHLPFDPNLVRILLPQDVPTFLIDIRGEVSPPRPEQIPARKYLTYGSSITNGGDVPLPTQSYAMRTACLLDVDLVNLGFSGSAQLEEGLADYLADQVEWDFASLELGVNVLDWSTEKFAQKVDYFVSKIAESHPDRWIFCIDIFTSGADFRRENKKADEFREVVREKVASLNLPRLVHLPGRELLTRADGLTTDLTHPSAIGMEEIAQNLSRHIRQLL